MNKTTAIILGLCIVTISVLAGLGKVQAAAVAGLLGTIVNALLPALVGGKPPTDPLVTPPTLPTEGVH